MNSRGQQAVNISAAFTALAFIVVSLRLYTRFFLVRCPGIEDYGIILAMICSIGLTICIGYQATYGMGQHIGDLQPEQMESSLKAFWASLIVYYLSLGLTKGSILLQYRRVFTTKKFQIACWTVMAVVVCYTMWTVFSSIFACVPIRAFWTDKKDARCINQFAMWFTNAAINILTDFAIIILPIPVIRRLSLGQRQKTALIAIFGVGGADASLGSLVSSFEYLYNSGVDKFRVASLVCIVSILRLQSLVAISNSDDPTYDNPPAATWSSVETNVGIICSCLPLLRPLLIRWIPGATSLKRSTTAPRAYATIGSTRNNKELSDPEFMMSTKMSHLSHEDPRNIEVITDIHIQVEGGERRLSDWRAPPAVPPKNWETTIDSRSERKREGSQDSLVKDVAAMV